MKQSYNDLVKRIQALSITCDVKDENGVIRHFHNGHEYVEIGGRKWATMNVGAEKPTDCGLYFQWGDTFGHHSDEVLKGEKNFEWTDYKHCEIDCFGREHMIKYTDELCSKLMPSDDGVALNWGGKWRIPTKDEFQALINNTDKKWTSNYKNTEAQGVVLTPKNGDRVELFLLAAGYCFKKRYATFGKHVFFWFSSTYHNCSSYAEYGNLDRNTDLTLYFTSRCVGFPLRGIIDE